MSLYILLTNLFLHLLILRKCLKGLCFYKMANSQLSEVLLNNKLDPGPNRGQVKKHQMPLVNCQMLAFKCQTPVSNFIKKLLAFKHQKVAFTRPKLAFKMPLKVTFKMQKGTFKCLKLAFQFNEMDHWTTAQVSS